MLPLTGEFNTENSEWHAMDIGKRLRELREAKGWSQGHIEKRTGLFRCYVSRVECGHTIPSLETLEKWAKALDLELYQLFFVGNRKPKAPAVAPVKHFNPREERLLDLFRQIPEPDRQLLLGMARELARRNGRQR